MSATKTINIKYHAMLREQRGCSDETIQTTSATAKELYKELATKYSLNFSLELLRVAINNEFREWDAGIQDSDTVIFIPPVSGG